MNPRSLQDLAVAAVAWLFLMAAGPAGAVVAPVEVRIPEPTAWTGQRLKIYVDLRSRGTFSGTASFSLPEIPRAVLMKLESPVVSSQTLEGESWFVQTHELALFSQQPGKIEIPAFEIRFESREGFAGEAKEIKSTAPARQVEIRQPPGTDQTGFLVTTPRLEITETWDPPPGSGKVGDIFKRTITQSADQISGMALAPPPLKPPEGFRIYPSPPQVIDQTERGDFSAKRVDTLTYVAQEAGELTIPAIRYDWWNPKSGKLESKSLPAVRFTFTAPPPPPRPPSPARFLWLLAPVVLVGLGIAFRKPVASFCRQLRDRIDPPPRRAARAFLSACRHNDPVAAGPAWNRWCGFHRGFEPGGDLRAKLLEMQRQLYGGGIAGRAWSGHELARAFRDAVSATPATPAPSALPALNVTDGSKPRPASS